VRTHRQAVSNAELELLSRIHAGQLYTVQGPDGWRVPDGGDQAVLEVLAARAVLTTVPAGPPGLRRWTTTTGWRLERCLGRLYVVPAPHPTTAADAGRAAA
jgi:hypothetical protein